MSQSLRRIHIDQVNIGHRFRKELGPLDGLGTSIRERGLMQPIVVCEVPGGYRLIAGERRFRAVRDLGESMIDAKVYEAKAELTLRLMERDENAERKDMTPSEKVELGKKIERLLGERRGRPGKSEKPNENGDGKVCHLAHFSGKRTAEVTAEAVGFDSARAYQRAKRVVENGVAETIQAMDEGVISVSDAAKTASLPKSEQRKAVSAVRERKARTASAASRRSNGTATAVKGDADEGELEQFTDAEGAKVPADAVPAFQAAKDIKSICSELNNIINRVEVISKGPGGRLIRFESFKQQIADAKGNIWANRATHVCPYCKGTGQGKGKDCEACKGECWAAKHIYVAAPGVTKHLRSRWACRGTACFATGKPSGLASVP